MSSSPVLTRRTGSCLCGRVKFAAAKASNHVHACHCGMCRKRGGGPLLAVDCGADVEFESTLEVARYDSSDWAQRGFCRTCGSDLFYFLKPAGKYFIPVGLFDDDAAFELHQEIFIDSKPAYYELNTACPKLTAAQVLASQ